MTESEFQKAIYDKDIMTELYRVCTEDGKVTDGAIVMCRARIFFEQVAGMGLMMIKENQPDFDEKIWVIEILNKIDEEIIDWSRSMGKKRAAKQYQGLSIVN